MRTAIKTVLVTVLILVIAGFVVVYAGVYNVAASDAHWPVVRWVLEEAKTRSIRAHAAEIAAPPSLDDPAMVRQGVEHFAAHCAVCHGAPGVPKAEIARGMNPPPPDLAKAAGRYSPAELFWIVRNGIKMTGMPAWPDHSEAELWATVAFVDKLPAMTQADYAKLLQDSMSGGGHHHDAAPGGDGHDEHDHKH